MGVLKNIPLSFLKAIFRLAVVITILCFFSMVLCVMYSVETLVIAVLGSVFSGIPAIASYLCLRKYYRKEKK